jgi:hypothetical protein
MNSRGEQQMKQKTPGRVLLLLALILLLLPLRARAATSDEFIRGYATAVVHRELQLKDFSLEVAGQTVRLRAPGLSPADHGKVIAALQSIDGVTTVEIVDGHDVVLASSNPQSTGKKAGVLADSDFELGFLPHGHLFDPLIADPRWPRFSIGYRYFTDTASHVGSATFGETFALYRWRGAGGFAEAGFQAGVFSIFDLGAPSSDLVNSDFFVALQASYRKDDLSTMFRIFHQSSHLGDEFLLRTRIDRVNLSYEGVDLKLSYRPTKWLRLYGGGAYMFDLDPPGIKLDFQTRQENKWSSEISLRGGLQFERPLSFMRKISLLMEYYKGHSPNGQFFTEKIEYFGPGLHLDF